MKRFFVYVTATLLLPLLFADVIKTAYNWRSARFFDVCRFCFGAFYNTINNILSFK